MSAHDLPDSPHFKFWPTDQLPDGSWKKQPPEGAIEPKRKLEWTSNGTAKHPGWAVVPQPSGVLCVDIDVKNGGQGVENMNKWVGYDFVEHWRTRTYVEVTASGGFHVFFLRATDSPPTDDRSETVVNVDFLAKSHIVCMGTAGYKQISSTSDIAICPKVIESVVLVPISAKLEKRGPKVIYVTSKHAYIQGALQNAFNEVANAMVGTRNETLNRVAFGLAQLGVDKPQVIATLEAAAKRLGWPRLNKTDLDTIESGCGAGYLAPITLEVRTEAEECPVDEAAMIQTLVANFRSTVAHTPSLGLWYAKTDNRWEPLHNVNGHLYDLYSGAVPHFNLTDKQLLKYRSNRMSDSMVSRLMKHTGFQVNVDYFDNDDTVFAAKNSVIDLRTGETVDSPTTKRGDVNYDRTATECPNWMKFLRYSSDDDVEFLRWLQVAVGYTLTGQVTANAIFLVIGQGGTGKSTFLKVLSRIMGTYATEVSNAVIFKQGKFDSSSNTAEFGKAALMGIRCGTINEVEVNAKFNAANMKALVSDGMISARRSGKDPVPFRSQVKLWVASNVVPGFWQTDSGTERRLFVVKFDKKVQEREADYFVKRLEPELPAILNWAVKGAMAWLAEGTKELPKCERVVLATKEVIDENASIKHFVEECVDLDKGFTSSHDLYVAYEGWCYRNALETPCQKAWFIRDFKVITNARLDTQRDPVHKKKCRGLVVTVRDC